MALLCSFYFCHHPSAMAYAKLCSLPKILFFIYQRTGVHASSLFPTLSREQKKPVSEISEEFYNLIFEKYPEIAKESKTNLDHYYLRVYGFSQDTKNSETYVKEALSILKQYKLTYAIGLVESIVRISLIPGSAGHDCIKHFFGVNSTPKQAFREKIKSLLASGRWLRTISFAWETTVAGCP